MSRKKSYRFAWCLLFCCGQVAVAQAQKAFNVLDWKSDVSLNTYLLQQMHAQYDVRRAAWNKALQSPQAARAYQRSVRGKFRALLGDLPARNPLQPRTVGMWQGKGYRVEKIVYESFPHHHVTANLYLPDGKGPFAAALLFCGHEDVSKATESYQKTAMLLARNGFVVLVIDPVSQGERYQLTDAGGHALTRGGTTEHTLLNQASNLLGGSTPADELWDNVRGLDYLVTRKEVDTARIGCLGNSGGAMQTIYFAAYEPRVKLFIPCSYLAGRERTLELSGPADGCAQMPGEGLAGLEMDDYLLAAAPKPLLVLAGRYDFIDYTGTIAAYGELKKYYRLLGRPEQVALFTCDDGHGISLPKREAAVTWLRRWLYHDARPVREPAWTVLTAQELQVTHSGQVASEFPDEVSLARRNLDAFDAAAVSRQAFLAQDKKQVVRAVRQLLRMDDTRTTAVQAEERGELVRDGMVFHRLILRKEGALPMPALLVLPKGKPKQLIIAFPGKGKNKTADSADVIQAYLRQGNALLLADLCGLGETEDKPELNDPKFSNREYRNAMLALHTGSSLVGLRTADMETALQFAAQDARLKGLPLIVQASGFAAIPALHAALLHEEIGQWQVELPFHSYREVFERPEAKDGYSYVVPGMLRYYDLPDLVRLAGAQKFSWPGPGGK